MTEQESYILKNKNRIKKQKVENDFNHVFEKIRWLRGKKKREKESKYSKALTMICLDSGIIDSCFSSYFWYFLKASIISMDYFYDQWYKTTLKKEL